MKLWLALLLALGLVIGAGGSDALVKRKAAEIVRAQPPQAEPAFGVWELLPDHALYFIVVEATTNGVLCEVKESNLHTGEMMHVRYAVIRNHPEREKLVGGDYLRLFRARKVDRVTVHGETAPVYDCLPPQPPKLTPDELTAALVAQKSAVETAKKAVQERKAEAAAKAVKWNLDQAEKGDAFGQFRMGQRYLVGDGVGKDLAKAKAMFEKAAVQGHDGAKAELKKMTDGK